MAIVGIRGSILVRRGWRRRGRLPSLLWSKEESKEAQSPFLLGGVALMEDGDPCTYDKCESGVCVHPPRTCNDDDKCTDDSCNSSTGLCEFQPKNCDDGEPCTNDSCDSTTGLCRNIPNCRNPDRTCCPVGTTFYCCNVEETVCCSDPAFPYHCCLTGKICCGAGCCDPAENQECCNGVCGTKGACCFFDTGSCTELTHLCCDQQGGAYQGDGTTCSPADLCRPACENCHAVNRTFYECYHEQDAPDPCNQAICMIDAMTTASCEMFPYRKGGFQCNTFDTGIEGELVQTTYYLPAPGICETSNPYGELRIWEPLLWSGCAGCVYHGYSVRCDTTSCAEGGIQVGQARLGTIRACGCP